MPAKRERVVKALMVVVSGAYYLMWVLAALVVVLPLLHLLGVPGVHMSTSVAVTLPTPAATVTSDWGNGVFVLRDARAVMEIPWGLAPGWFILVDWLRQALGVALLLLLLHELRGFFREVRAGNAFSTGNALRLRRMGLLLLTFFLVAAVLGSILALAGRLAVKSSTVHLGTILGGSLTPVLVGLVLLVLAEVFGHGAELEEERALVI